jgi:hypothetical protein
MVDPIFERMATLINEQAQVIRSISEKIQQIESFGGGGGGGSASIEDYQTGKLYVRNVLVVDTTTETVYRVLSEYTSVTVDDDTANGYLKLVGFESQLVTFNHNPTQTEIDTLPDDSLVAVYSSADQPYIPGQQ